MNNDLTAEELEENEIQLELEKSIDSYENFIFDAGAGAGKTYSLVKLLKYITINNGTEFVKKGQNVVCITYTNIAKNEIEKRLGKNKLVLTSTIHERVWEWIGRHKKELDSIHRNKISREIKKIKGKKNFVPEQVGKIGILAENKEFINHYYNIKNLEKKDFLIELKKKFVPKIETLVKVKEVIEGEIKIKKYEKALKDGSKKVKYDPLYPYDRLEKFIISHDTLLEYGSQILKENELLCDIILDKNPIILIDEYQDTSPYVVEMMVHLNKSKKRNFIVGYFGDKAQNIYNNGIGKNLEKTYKDYKVVPPKIIKKLFNRRSKNEIINISNNIRNDDIKQKSINPEKNKGGSFEFYKLISKSSDAIKDFINKKEQEMGKTQILFLTNKSKASHLGVKTFYNILYNTKYYRNIKNDLPSDFFNIEKISGVPKLFNEIYNYIKFFHEKNIITSNLVIDSNDLTLKEFDSYIKYVEKKLEGIDETTNSLKSVFKVILEIFDSNNKIKLKVKEYLKKEFEFNKLKEEYTYSNFNELLKRMLNVNDQRENLQNILEDLMEIPFIELKKQDNILKKGSGVISSTYHGTKGDEFTNVIIIMENKFKNSNVIKNYFEVRENHGVLSEQDQITQNLIYVVSSRAKENLKILYVNDISSFQKGIKNAFGITEIKEW